MATNLTDVIKALEAKGIDYELTGENTAISIFDGTVFKDETNYFCMLGISLTDWIWHWHAVYSFEEPEKTFYSFKQRYSQNTGKSVKSYREGSNFRNRLAKKINIEL